MTWLTLTINTQLMPSSFSSTMCLLSHLHTHSKVLQIKIWVFIGHSERWCFVTSQSIISACMVLFFFFLILSHVEQLGLVGFTVFKTLRSCPTLPLSLSLFLLTLFFLSSSLSSRNPLFFFSSSSLFCVLSFQRSLSQKCRTSLLGQILSILGRNPPCRNP